MIGVVDPLMTRVEVSSGEKKGLRIKEFGTGGDQRLPFRDLNPPVPLISTKVLPTLVEPIGASNLSPGRSILSLAWECGPGGNSLKIF